MVIDDLMRKWSDLVGHNMRDVGCGKSRTQLEDESRTRNGWSMFLKRF